MRYFWAPPNQQHTAHHHGDLIIRYPFHPLCGELITVIGMNNYRGESYLTIRQADGTLALLPPWMASQDAALMSVVPKPALPHPVLVELLHLIDAALSSLALTIREGGRGSKPEPPKIPAALEA